MSPRDISLACAGCGRRYRVDLDKVPAGTAGFPCRACGRQVPLVTPTADSSGGPLILIALNESEITASVLRILARGGMNGVVAHTGAQALQLAAQGAGRALFISVVLPDMLGFEVIEKARDLPGGGDLPILLLSSLFHPARYKRAPTSLYGADDYIEMHHLPDFLLPKLNRFLEAGRGGEPVRPQGRSGAPVTVEEQEEARRIAEAAPESQPPADAEEEGVLRMTRIIVADVALYNEETVSGKTVPQALESLERDLSEGRALLLRRFPDLGEEKAAALLASHMTRLLERRQGGSRGK